MAVLKFADRVAESTVYVGSGDIPLAGAIDTDHDTFGNQFADGEEMPVSVFGGGKWMTFRGRYNSGANSLTRVTFRDSSTGSNLSLSGTMTVMCGWDAADAAAMIRTDETQALSAAQRAQARGNAGAAINELQNVTFGVTASAGALTIALKDAAGNDATASTPIALSFRNPSLTASPNGPTVLELTAAASVVVPSTSTCGFVSAVAGRLWIAGWNDGGTFRLGVFNASTVTSIFQLEESGVASSLQVVAAGNAAGQHYTAGAAVTSKAYRILGYVDWNSSGVATAGTWTTTNLNSIVTFGPGIKKPGDVVKSQYVAAAGSSSTSGSFVDVTGSTVSFTQTNPANINKVVAAYNAQVTNSAGNNMQWQGRLMRDATSLQNFLGAAFTSAGGNGWLGPGAWHAWDKPNTVSACAYKTQHVTNVPGVAVFTNNLNMTVEELMG